MNSGKGRLSFRWDNYKGFEARQDSSGAGVGVRIPENRSGGCVQLTPHTLHTLTRLQFFGGKEDWSCLPDPGFQELRVTIGEKPFPS